MTDKLTTDGGNKYGVWTQEQRKIAELESALVRPDTQGTPRIELQADFDNAVRAADLASARVIVGLIVQTALSAARAELAQEKAAREEAERNYTSLQERYQNDIGVPVDELAAAAVDAAECERDLIEEITIERCAKVCRREMGYSHPTHQARLLDADEILALSPTSARESLAALRRDAERLQEFMDQSAKFYQEGYDHFIRGRLREYIDAAKEPKK